MRPQVFQQVEAFFRGTAFRGGTEKMLWDVDHIGIHADCWQANTSFAARITHESGLGSRSCCFRCAQRNRSRLRRTSLCHVGTATSRLGTLLNIIIIVRHILLYLSLYYSMACTFMIIIIIMIIIVLVIVFV